MPQTWPVGTAVAFYVALSTTVLRVYVVGVTTAALQGSVRSARELFVTSQRRLPAVVVTLIAVLIVGAVAIGLASILSWGLLSTLTWVDELAGTSLSSESIYDGASATLIFGSASALAIFKFWLAPEICVVGGYNPLTALRLSWSVTSLHWFRVLIVIVGFSLTVFLPQIGKQTLSALGGSWLLWDPLTGFIQMLFYGVGYAIWFAVGTQIYVRSTLP
ncbi:hypothetical protein C500_14590 [Natrialba magadii ATCC 43099]|nr:hypothetical protein C500_14590 [Natrialba magadii ATCC 43099]